MILPLPWLTIRTVHCEQTIQLLSELTISRSSRRFFLCLSAQLKTQVKLEGVAFGAAVAASQSKVNVKICTKILHDV